MTNYEGIEVSEFIPLNDSVVIDRIANFSESGFGVESGDKAHGQITLDNKILSGLEVQNWAQDFIWDRIWFSPKEFAAGFIVESTPVEVEIWNAFLKESKDIETLTINNVFGTSSPAQTIPETILPFEKITKTITLLEQGPAKQDTTYTYTIDGDDYSILFTGIRIERIAFEPNWANGVEVTFNLETAISKSKWTFNEQRRPLMGVPSRELSCEFFEEDELANYLVNQLEAVSNRTIAVPVYTEPMTPTEDFVGTLEINIEEDITKYWNLNNQCSFLVLIDSETKEVEVKELFLIDGSTLTVVNEISDIFNWEDTVIYPVFLGTAQEISPVWITDNKLKISIVFQETQFE